MSERDDIRHTPRERAHRSSRCGARGRIESTSAVESSCFRRRWAERSDLRARIRLVSGSVIVTKQERVYRAIRERILSGAYGPGYRVVIDALAEEFEVSGLPVREAIRRLEAEGLVIYRPNAGAQVAPGTLQAGTKSVGADAAVYADGRKCAVKCVWSAVAPALKKRIP